MRKSNYKIMNKINIAINGFGRIGIVKTYDYIKERGTREFDYNINLEIINDLTPETWKKKEI